MIQGWDVGVASMCKGEVSKFTFAPKYAYGEEGSPPKIPQEATLIFEIELINFTSKDDLFSDGGGPTESRELLYLHQTAPNL